MGLTQQQLFDARQKYIDERQQALVESASELEALLLDAIEKQYLFGIKTENNIITPTAENLQKINKIDLVFEKLNSGSFMIAEQLIKDFSRLINMNKDYYSVFGTPQKKYTKLVEEVKTFMKQRIGLDDKGNVIPDGFLDQLIKDDQLLKEVKNRAYRAVTGGQNIGDLSDSLKILIVGNKNVDGALTQYYKGFVYDTYVQFDRATNKAFADRLDLRAFVYSGGLIETSREFCIKKNGKVFTIEEADEWVNDPDLPRTVDERKTGVIVNYLPLIDMGRWNCRHIVRYVSEQLAIRMRPDLIAYFAARKAA